MVLFRREPVTFLSFWVLFSNRSENDKKIDEFILR